MKDKVSIGHELLGHRLLKIIFLWFLLDCDILRFTKYLCLFSGVILSLLFGDAVLDPFLGGVGEGELVDVIIEQAGNLISCFLCDVLQASIEADVFLELKGWFDMLFSGDDCFGEIIYAVLSDLTGQLNEIF